MHTCHTGLFWSHLTASFLLLSFGRLSMTLRLSFFLLRYAYFRQAHFFYVPFTCLLGMGGSEVYYKFYKLFILKPSLLCLTNNSCPGSEAAGALFLSLCRSCNGLFCFVLPHHPSCRR
ncbi:hypothetical protein BJV78DRAFT_1251676 [Lactifluus subvellereus]|nr:hypothetical protein BJV78DRAFT_1251676 [Lactifluus subvellereus]